MKTPYICSPVREHEAVTRAVHRLEAVLFLLDVEGKHVLLVVGGVARGLPQVEIVDVGRDDLSFMKKTYIPETMHEKIKKYAHEEEERERGRKKKGRKRLL
jgi:hypothetical protein